MLGIPVHVTMQSMQVPDLEVARLFYAEGLGLTPDPSMTGSQRGGAHVMWYNVGRQQVRSMPFVYLKL